MNTVHEALFTELTSEQAATVEGGRFCPYTTQGVTDRLRIRSGPSTNSRIVGYWYPGQTKLMQEPAILQNGFRAFSSKRDRWVSARYIKRTAGACAE